jgi:hypothetical protein
MSDDIEQVGSYVGHAARDLDWPVTGDFHERIMRLAGAVYNASYTILRLRKEQLRLFTFNAAPHLAAPGLCTHR